MENLKVAKFCLRVVTRGERIEDSPTYDKGDAALSFIHERVLGSGWDWNIEDRKVEIPYQEEDLSQHPMLKQLGISDNEAVKYLVLYDNATSGITVDKRAPIEYKELAVLHEAVCQGHQHEDWAGVQNDNSEYRCSHIEENIFEECIFMQNYDLSDYFRKRALMFSFLIKYNFNPELRLSFIKSLEMVMIITECYESLAAE